jgi:hypothetical protein
MPPSSKRCQFCRKAFSTQRGVNQHISASSICLKEWHKTIVRTNDDDRLPKCRRTNSPEPNILDNLLNEANDRANVEEAANNGDETDGDETDPATPKRFIEPFPGTAGGTLRQETTQFEVLEREQRLEGMAPWELFASRVEWELVEWLIKSVGQKSTEKYLQLPIVSRDSLFDFF